MQTLPVYNFVLTSQLEWLDVGFLFREITPKDQTDCFTRAEWAGGISWGKAAQRFPCFLFSQHLGEWEKSITHDSVCSNSVKQSADTLLMRTQWCANYSNQNTSSVWTS